MVDFDWGMCVFDGRSGVSLDGRWALSWDWGRSVGEKSLSGFRKALFWFFVFFINIMLMWKIVGVSKVSVIYIYIYIYRL